MYPGVFAPNEAFTQAPAQKLRAAGPAAQQCPTPQGVLRTEGLERRGSRGWEGGAGCLLPLSQFHRIAGVEAPGVSPPRGWGSGVGGEKRSNERVTETPRTQEPAE